MKYVRFDHQVIGLFEFRVYFERGVSKRNKFLKCVYGTLQNYKLYGDFGPSTTLRPQGKV